MKDAAETIDPTQFSRTSHRPAQLELFGFSLSDAANKLRAETGVEERGAIFTRPEVVEFILDLVGYTADKPLHRSRLLEPSIGQGDFLFPAIERLFRAFRASGDRTNPIIALKDAIRGVELHHKTFEVMKTRLMRVLEAEGLSHQEAATLVSSWLREGDFLLTDFDFNFSHVIGNPPYVRQELIPDILMAEYRRRYATIFDRADLYIPFIEKGLSSLAAGGKLAFICADRWMKNRYGAPLRRLISDHYHLHTYVDMVDTPAFHDDVIAYPGIFVIGKDRSAQTRFSYRPAIDAEILRPLARALREGSKHPDVVEGTGIVSGEEPWIVDSPLQLAVVRRLEAQFPTIEDAGCKVGIGVATGADKIFVAKYDALDVEPSRKLPLAMSRDITSGTVKWRGYGVLNPFEEDGRLASFSEYPKFARYLEEHGEAIKRRHISQKNPGSWYRTIDRIYPSLTYKPKLLLPDIKGEANVVFEEGKLYPHHNLYVLTSDTWDLRALQAVMLSSIAKLFVSTYSTKMRGGYLKFQAQYVRRIRVPHWHAVDNELRKALIAAAHKNDRDACDAAVAALYDLTTSELEALGIDRKTNVCR